MFVRTPRSVVLLTGETCMLLAAVVAGTFLRPGTMAVPALSDGGGILRVFLIVGCLAGIRSRENNPGMNR